MTTLAGELFAARKRPAVWIICGVWLALILVFGIGVPFIVFLALSAHPNPASGSPHAVLAVLLPNRMVGTTVGLFPLYGTAVMLILGAVVFGAEYRWGTLGTLLTQSASRSSVVLAKLAVLAAVVLCVSVASLLLVAVSAAIIAAVERQPQNWPALQTMVAGIGAAWPVGTAAASLGGVLAVLFRSIGTALAVGLLWVLALESAVSGLTYVLPSMKVVQPIFIGSSAGSLAGAFGAPTRAQGGNPLIVAPTGPGIACAVLLAYIAITWGITILTLRRRDVF